jgi:hypothetical protein
VRPEPDSLSAEGVKRADARPEIGGGLVPTQQARRDEACGSKLAVYCLAAAAHGKNLVSGFLQGCSMAALPSERSYTRQSRVIYFSYYSGAELRAKRCFRGAPSAGGKETAVAPRSKWSRFAAFAILVLLNADAFFEGRWLTETVVLDVIAAAMLIVGVLGTLFWPDRVRFKRWEEL